MSRIALLHFRLARKVVRLLAAFVAPLLLSLVTATAARAADPPTFYYEHWWTLTVGCGPVTGTGYTPESYYTTETISGSLDNGVISSHTVYNGPYQPGYWADGSFPLGGGTISNISDVMGQQLAGNAQLTGVTALSCGESRTYYLRFWYPGGDTTPPDLTVPADITTEATSAAGAVVTFTITATDAVDPAPVVTANPSSGSQFPLGTTMVTARATDASGNVSTKTFKIGVVYGWSGVQQPVNSDGSSVFKLGSVVPVKFALTGASTLVTDAVARLSYAKISDGIEGTVLEAVTNVAATSGNLFRYDPAGAQYIYNWSTKGLNAGTYSLKVDLGDGVPHAVTVSLR